MGICQSKLSKSPINSSVYIDEEQKTNTASSFRATGNEDSQKQLEAFIELASCLYSIDSLQILLRKETGREAFRNFLATEHATENLSFYLAIEALLDRSNFSQKAKEIINTYLVSGCDSEINLSSSMKTNLIHMLNEAVASSQVKEEELSPALKKLLLAAQNEILKLMALGAYPRFMKSGLFFEWRSNDRLKTLTENDVLRDISVSPSKSTTTKANEIASTDFNPESICKIEMRNFSQTGNWMANFMVAVDNLPVSMSVATAREDRRGFPLIFVNKAFVQGTQFSYKDTIGLSCSLLQSSDSVELEQKEKLAKGLREAKPVYAIITNCRKDGSKFLNLVSMKPLFDQNNKYRFVIALQFVVDPDNRNQMIPVMESLMELLPDKLYCYDNE